MIKSLKVMTVVGTRPEIIRMAAVMRLLDSTMNHIMVHTGQNYDYELNEVFYEDLGLRRPDYFLEADTSSLGAVLGSILEKIQKVIETEKPDAMVVLGDTNSCISALMGRRLKVPVFHLEAGNRAFDPNVPEEINRKLVDHVSDYNLVYSEHARRNLLTEGIHPSKIQLMGSPMAEVLQDNKSFIDSSQATAEAGFTPGEFILVSLHREENVDNPFRLVSILEGLSLVKNHFKKPVLVSTHPRTRKRIEQLGELESFGLTFHKPFGFNDYIRLQEDALIVLSDSGTISEESSILGFPAISIRDSIERPEAIDTSAALTSGVTARGILETTILALDLFNNYGPAQPPVEYKITDSARRVVSFIQSHAPTHQLRNGIRNN